MAESSSGPGRGSLLVTNEAYLRCLWDTRALDLSDPIAVFRFVFAELQDVVTVYPSENRYYFQFPTRVGLVWGSLGLYAVDRDRGVLTFGYVAKPERIDRELQPIVGGSRDLTAADGVMVTKCGENRYLVGFESRQVEFHLPSSDSEWDPRAALADDEDYVGSSLDESGLAFDLIYNREHCHLYWVLNERGDVAERFLSVCRDVVLGERTRLVFFCDKACTRKILVGAHRHEVLNNTWFDGPVDELPDNAIESGAVDVKMYIEASLPQFRGRIDRFGYIRYGNRAAVGSYKVYERVEDLCAFVSDVLRQAPTPSSLRTTLTSEGFI